MVSVSFATNKEQMDFSNNEADSYKTMFKCDCLPSCTDISYELELSQNTMKWKPINKLYKNIYDKE